MDGIPKTNAVEASLVLLLISNLSFVSFLAQNESSCVRKREQAKHIKHLNLLCSQQRATAKRDGMCGDPSAVATHIEPCTWNCSFCLLPGVPARKRTWLKTARSHLTESCLPVLAVKRILKLRCDSHGRSICRWRPGRRWWLLEQQSPASSLPAGMGDAWCHGQSSVPQSWPRSST